MALRQADLRAAFEFLLTVQSMPDADAFADALVASAGRVIPADLISYNEIDPVRRRAYFLANPADAVFPGAQAVLEAHMDENPLVVHHARTGDGSARMWSDFITQRQLHETALYDGLFQPLGVERQMVATLPAPPPLLIGLVFMRGGRDFSERDRAMLDLLRPHLLAAYETARLCARRVALERALEAGSEGIAVVARSGRIVDATPVAARLLRSHFESDGADRLPLALASADPPAELTFPHNGTRVLVRLLPGEPRLVWLREEPIDPEPDALRSLGLSRRESQVLALVAGGRTNLNVGELLGIKPRTVKKHLDRIYAKLGVRTRTAAAAEAYRAALR